MKTRNLWLVLGVSVAVILAAALVLLPAAGATRSASADSCAVTHIVEYGETAALIARQYGISVAELARANDLENPNWIYAGQSLCIPEGGDASETTTETTTTQPANGNTTICVDGQVIDTAHKAIAGLTVLAGDGSAAGQKAVSDENGNFSFDGLTPGEWTFRVEYPDSWDQVTPAEFKVQVDYGRIGCYQVRFKLRPLGCVIVTKVNGDGQPLAGWPVSVSGPVDPEATTDANGAARFDGLLPGSYVVEETVLYPWKALSPTSVAVEVKPAREQDDCAKVEFKNEKQKTSCIIGQKVDDQHKPIAGWKIHARSAEGLEVDPQVTDKDGNFLFDNLTLGTWTLSEDVQDGWTPITPAEFSVMLTKESKSPECVTVRFKNRPPDLCAEGYKVDENGVGLAGWTVVAYSESDPALQLKATTDSKGYYRFNGLTLDNWVFEVQPQVGWTAIDTDFVKIPIKAGEYCTQVPIFRNQSPRGCIEGYKRDGADRKIGLPGWSISVQPVGGGIITTAKTDGTGYFRFDNLPVGEYEVWETAQAGWAPVTPTKYVVKLEPKDKYTCEPVEFINKQVARDICIDGYKLDEYGKVGLPGFAVTAKNAATGDVLEAKTDGLGYFRFGKLDSGKYEIAVAEQEGWTPVGASMQTVTVDWPPKLTCTTVKFYDEQVGPSTPAPDPAPDDGTCSSYYTVKYGDTLADIAAVQGTTASALKAANSLDNADLIYTGQELCIP